VKLPLEENPGQSSRNCLWEAGIETALLSSVEMTHWFQPWGSLLRDPVATALGPMGHVNVEGKGKEA